MNRQQRVKPIISRDGYIRIPCFRLETILLVHLISGLDEAGGNRDSTATLITGYTEWISCTRPFITIGWDWQMTAPFSLARTGIPRSNLMLETEKLDLGPSGTSDFIENFIDAMEWKKTVLDNISRRYSGCHN